MRQKVKKILSCVILVCLICGALGYLTNLMQRKDSSVKYKDFFSQKENFDVLFMGSSHVINAVFPMELWKDYGIVSYNMGGHGNQMATTYWVMKNALDHTTPKLMVIDGMHLNFDIKTGYDFSGLHVSFDAFPLSWNKRAAIRDLLDDEKMNRKIEAGEVTVSELREELSILWNYSVYHSRWRELGHDDFYPDVSEEKGAESRIAVAIPQEIKKVPPDSQLERETLGVQYLRKMIEECQEQGIEVLLVYLPFPAQEQDFKNANRMYEIAKEYGVNYINFLDMDIVDYSTDCYDEGSHLNPSGARKVTDYLGQYIMEHYEIADQRTNVLYEEWQEDYEEYSAFKRTTLCEQQELDTYLMLLADKNWDVTIQIYNPYIWEYVYYSNLFRNLGVDPARIRKGADLLVVEQGGTLVQYFENTRDMGVQVPDNTCVHLTVRESGTEQIVDSAYFCVQVQETPEDAAKGIKITAVR